MTTPQKQELEALLEEWNKRVVNFKSAAAYVSQRNSHYYDLLEAQRIQLEGCVAEVRKVVGFGASVSRLPEDGL